ncbi:MAG: hypothetical protein ACKPI8_06975 [Microcystis panniformis]
MTTAAPNPFKIFPLFQLSVISYQLSVGQLSVISGSVISYQWQVASGKWGSVDVGRPLRARCGGKWGIWLKFP